MKLSLFWIYLKSIKNNVFHSNKYVFCFLTESDSQKKKKKGKNTKKESSEKDGKKKEEGEEEKETIENKKKKKNGLSDSGESDSEVNTYLIFHINSSDTYIL